MSDRLRCSYCEENEFDGCSECTDQYVPDHDVTLESISYLVDKLVQKKVSETYAESVGVKRVSEGLYINLANQCNKRKISEQDKNRAFDLSNNVLTDYEKSIIAIEVFEDLFKFKLLEKLL